MNIVRKTYDWVLHWADTRWGVAALFILAFAESSFFPIPPDVLLIALCLGIPRRSFRYALIATMASVMGAVAGYTIGYYAWLSNGEFTSFANFFFNNIPGFTHEIYNKISVWYEAYDFWVVFTAGFTPIPYKVITITSGVFNINFMVFIIASIISRGARFFLISALIWKYGTPIKSFINKYFNLLAIAFTVLL
ncbi:MAG: YqaA family protein, partial [Rikenellaceae bacterium]